jgi:hypothetical protein
MKSMHKDTEALIGASKEVGLKASTEKIEYIVTCNIDYRRESGLAN